jgi:hypothetical protein
MENLNNQFKNGICPRELNYNINTSCIDFNKLRYNSRYQSYDFYGAKFPKQWSDEPLFIPLIQSLADKAKANNITPLDELNNITTYNNDPNPSE